MYRGLKCRGIEKKNRKRTNCDQTPPTTTHSFNYITVHHTNTTWITIQHTSHPSLSCVFVCTCSFHCWLFQFPLTESGFWVSIKDVRSDCQRGLESPSVCSSSFSLIPSSFLSHYFHIKFTSASKNIMERKLKNKEMSVCHFSALLMFNIIVYNLCSQNLLCMWNQFKNLTECRVLIYVQVNRDAYMHENSQPVLLWVPECRLIS